MTVRWLILRSAQATARTEVMFVALTKYLEEFGHWIFAQVCLKIGWSSFHSVIFKSYLVIYMYNTNLFYSNWQGFYSTDRMFLWLNG